MISSYEPAALEIVLTLSLGQTLLSPYYRSFARKLKLRGDEKVLDFGSGSGMCSRHIAELLDKGGKLDCLDISRGWHTVIQNTMQGYVNVGCHLGSLGYDGLPNAAYDLVVIHFVIHDIPYYERQDAFRELGLKLRPGGRLVFREPKGQGLILADLERLAAGASLDVSQIKENRTVIGEVYDGILYHPEDSQE